MVSRRSPHFYLPSSKLSRIVWRSIILSMIFTRIVSSSFLQTSIRRPRFILMRRQGYGSSQIFCNTKDPYGPDDGIFTDVDEKMKEQEYYGLTDGEIAQSIKSAKTIDDYFKAIEGNEKTREFYRKASYGHDNNSFEQMNPEGNLSLITNRQVYLKRRVTLMAGKAFNPGSPKQVAQILYGDKSGGSTDKYTLETRFGNNEIAKDVLRWRQLESERKKTLTKISRKRNAEKNMSPYEIARRNNKVFTVKRSFSSTSGDESVEKLSDPLVLIDISGYIFRAYHAMPPLHRSDGTPTGAVLGVCNMLSRIILGPLLAGKESRVLLVYDSPGKNFRHDIYEEYKANRSECPEDLVPQFNLIRSAADAFGIPQVEAKGFEADDVIATLATTSCQAGMNVDIYSSDKDLMQLCTPIDVSPKINMIDPVKLTRITDDQVYEKWGVKAELLGDLLALAGDSSDNIPGVKGIGPKIAATLLNDFGSLEGCLENANKIKQKGRREKILQNLEMARISRKLVELDRYVPLETIGVTSDALTDIKVQPLDKKRIIRFLDEMQFYDMKRKTNMMFGDSDSSTIW